MTKKLNVAAVGIGWVAMHRHLTTMSEIPDYHIAGVIDRKPLHAEAIAKKYNCKRFYGGDSLDHVPWLNEVDAVTIGASPMSHYALIKSALNLGKHVLTEKPFTMKVEEGEELVGLAKKKNLVLGVVHNFQFASSALKLMRDIQSGKLGKVKSIAAFQFSNHQRRLPVWYEELPLGLFYDESPHFFYLVSRLSPGRLQFLRADLHPSTLGLRTPASLHVHYCSEGKGEKIPVTIQMNFEATVSEWQIFVFGEKHMGVMDVFRDIYLCLPNDGLHETKTVIRTSLLATWQHWAQHFTSGIKHITGRLRYGNETVFQRFASAVLEGKELNDISSADALRVLRMQHDVLSHQNVLYSQTSA